VVVAPPLLCASLPPVAELPPVLTEPLPVLPPLLDATPDVVVSPTPVVTPDVDEVLVAVLGPIELTLLVGPAPIDVRPPAVTPVVELVPPPAPEAVVSSAASLEQAFRNRPVTQDNQKTRETNVDVES